MNTKINIDDYSSYSSVVSTLQGDKILGKNAIVELVDLYFSKKTEQSQLEAASTRALLEAASLKHSIGHIASHLNMTYPFTIVFEDRVIQFDKDGIVEVNNVF